MTVFMLAHGKTEKISDSEKLKFIHSPEFSKNFQKKFEEFEAKHGDPGTGRVCFRTNDTECFDLIEDKRRFVAKDSAAKNITIFRS